MYSILSSNLLPEHEVNNIVSSKVEKVVENEEDLGQNVVEEGVEKKFQMLRAEVIA